MCQKKTQRKSHRLSALCLLWKTMAFTMPHPNYQLHACASPLFKLDWQNSSVTFHNRKRVPGWPPHVFSKEQQGEQRGRGRVRARGRGRGRGRKWVNISNEILPTSVRPQTLLQHEVPVDNFAVVISCGCLFEPIWSQWIDRCALYHIALTVFYIWISNMAPRCQNFEYILTAVF